MNNFERIKNAKDEYEMADLICGYVCNNLHKLKSKDSPEFQSLPFLKWLQSSRNIFDEDATNQ